MFEAYKKMWRILDKRERRNAILLFCLMLVMGLMDTAGVASVMPFISVISNPEAVVNNTYLRYVYNTFGFSNVQEYLIFLGCIVFVIIIMSLLVKSLTQYAMARYVHMRSASVSSRLLKGYLFQEYSFFLDCHTANLGKKILSETQEVISQTLLPCVQLAANSIVSLFLVGLVVIVNPVVAIISVLVIGVSYSCIYLFLRTYLNKIGVARVQANKKRFTVAQEALGGIKEVKVFGLEIYFLDNFIRSAKKFSKSVAYNQILGLLPRYLLEGLTFGGLIAVVVVMVMRNDGNISQVIPVIGLYAFAGYRLMPAMQNIYQSIAKIRFGKAGLDSVYKDLIPSVTGNEKQRFTTHHEVADKQEFKTNIVLDNISYKYPSSEKYSLKNLNLKIPAKQTVGLVGSTGAGKTTVVDIILGLLLDGVSGELSVDGVKMDLETVRVWKKNIGYVPQNFYLIDGTIAENIALGYVASQIDMNAVQNAAEIANLHQFVIDELPNGYNTPIGEQGIKLSGGQRQRLGIARALYHNPDVLILDEATSALDNFTEKAVMDAIHNLGKKKTIIIIAHRLSTVKKCDILYLLEEGQIVGQGSYDELLNSSLEFQKIVNN